MAHLFPATHDIPWATLIVNVAGAFLLGLLLEALLHAGAETSRIRLARLALGTGVLGGFTTYSALALELHELLADGRFATAVGYGLGSVSAGLLACVLGIVAGSRIMHSRAHRGRPS